MNRIQPWLGWIAIGVGVLALMVTLQGANFRSFGEGRFADNDRQQSSAVQSNGPQSSVGASASNEQGERTRGRNAPQNNASAANTYQEQGRFGSDSQRGSDRSTHGGFDFGEWLSFPFKLLRGLSQFILLGVVAVLGFLLLRGRRTPAAASSGGTQTTQAPAQGTPSPTGEWYTDEPNDQG